eukprot:TRINITY_DN26_c0_g1_i1.p1 TRINITY_DN26_c0_g1~~TRINITY_DN26_c0_g1_i1.p1  ORF type:complete len:298 (-),score=98.93 TRINITY_DN26_c0_g1_i1:81-905(-)
MRTFGLGLFLALATATATATADATATAGDGGSGSDSATALGDAEETYGDDEFGGTFHFFSSFFWYFYSKMRTFGLGLFLALATATATATADATATAGDGGSGSDSATALGDAEETYGDDEFGDSEFGGADFGDDEGEMEDGPDDDDDGADTDLDAADLNLELGPEEKCEMCTHIHAELAETTTGLPPPDVAEAVRTFCDTLDEEIADAVFDICAEFVKEHGTAVSASLVAKTSAPETCKNVGLCTDEMLAQIDAGFDENDGIAEENTEVVKDTE